MRDTMNKMSPNERIPDQLRVSSAGRTGGSCRSTEEDDRLLAAMAIADLANSLPVIAKTSPANLPGKKLQSSLPAQSDHRPQSTYQHHTALSAKMPRSLAESATKIQTAPCLKRKPPSVATLATHNGNKIAKITSGSGEKLHINSKMQSSFEMNNGTCSSDASRFRYPAVSREPWNANTGACVKSLPVPICGLARQGLTSNQEVIVSTNAKKSEGHPSVTHDHQQNPGGHSRSSAVVSHTTLVTCLSEPLIISSAVTRPVLGNFMVARPSSDRVDNVQPGQQVDVKNVALLKHCSSTASTATTATAVSSVTPAMTTVHVTHSSDCEVKNLKPTKKFDDVKNVPMVGVVRSHHIDAMKLPLKKRKLLKTQSVIPIVVAPHETTQGPNVARPTQDANRSTVSPPPAKVRLVKVEQEKQTEGRNEPTPQLIPAGRNTGRCLHSASVRIYTTSRSVQCLCC